MADMAFVELIPGEGVQKLSLSIYMSCAITKSYPTFSLDIFKQRGHDEVNEIWTITMFLCMIYNNKRLLLHDTLPS
jgi:hypothetical protein